MKFLYALLLSFFSFICYSQELTQDEKTNLLSFIEAVKTKNLNYLASHITFPLLRQFPLPDIKNKAELIYRYDELFDDSITKIIVNSNIDKDWSKVGWRGFMLNYGDIWIGELDYQLTAVNLQSSAERTKIIEIITNDKATLHASVKEFEYPVMVLKTSAFYIRIDELKDEVYRYSVWPVNISTSEKPSLIISNGTIEYMGSGGNHQYIFENNEYTYKCPINILGSDETPPANLIVEKNGAEIINEPAEIIRN